MTYDAVDEQAVQLVETAQVRVVFVCIDMAIGGYGYSTHSDFTKRPVKRYRRLSTGAIEVKAVSTWRRNW